MIDTDSGAIIKTAHTPANHNDGAVLPDLLALLRAVPDEAEADAGAKTGAKTGAGAGAKTGAGAGAEVGAGAGAEVGAVCADMAYDTTRCRRAIHDLGATQRIPPRRDALLTCENRNVPKEDRAALAERDAAVRRIRQTNRATWKAESGYHRRSLVETAIWRVKRAGGAHLANRTEANRATQAMLKCRLANILLAA